MSTRSVYWRVRETTAIRRLAVTFIKPIATLVAIVRAHDVSYVLPSQKRDVLLRVARDFGCQIFVETGTYRGDTSAAFAAEGLHVHTIELSPELAIKARERFLEVDLVQVYQGDSAVVLPEIMRQIDRPALFWLDAHFSSGATAGAGTDPPLSTELTLILTHGVFGHCIAIDDARDLLGANGYPTIKQVAKMVAKLREEYSVRIQSDIVIIAPSIM